MLLNCHGFLAVSGVLGSRESCSLGKAAPSQAPWKTGHKLGEAEDSRDKWSGGSNDWEQANRSTTMNPASCAMNNNNFLSGESSLCFTKPQLSISVQGVASGKPCDLLVYECCRCFAFLPQDHFFRFLSLPQRYVRRHPCWVRAVHPAALDSLWQVPASSRGALPLSPSARSH